MRSQMTALIAALCLLLAGAGWAASYHYSGNVGERTAVQMDLARQGTTLSGSYWYDDADLSLELKGSLRSGTATVKEFDENGKQTGAFTGTLSQDDRQFRGAWTSADGKRSLPFAFTAIAEYRTLDVKRKGYDVSGSYPAFLSTAPGWQALSKLLRAQVHAAQQNFLKETADQPQIIPDIDFDFGYAIGVAYADGALVSLLTEEGEYSGGAHSNSLYLSANYLMTGSAPRLLGLNDLFTPGSGYQDTLFELVVADLNRQKKARGADPVWEYFSVKDLKVYTLSPRSITFFFSPYVAGPYAEGPYYVTVPYSQLTQYLNPQGPLAKFTVR